MVLPEYVGVREGLAVTERDEVGLFVSDAVAVAVGTMQESEVSSAGGQRWVMKHVEVVTG